jgi:hypothetical protein
MNGDDKKDRDYVENGKLDLMGKVFKERQEDGMYMCTIMTNITRGIEDSVWWNTYDPGYKNCACSMKDCRDCILASTFINLIYQDYNKSNEGLGNK